MTVKVRIDGNVIRCDDLSDAQWLISVAERLHEERCFTVAMNFGNDILGSPPNNPTVLRQFPNRPKVKVLSIPSAR
jgi:hypothetical protein